MRFCCEWLVGNLASTVQGLDVLWSDFQASRAGLCASVSTAIVTRLSRTKKAIGRREKTQIRGPKVGRWIRGR